MINTIPAFHTNNKGLIGRRTYRSIGELLRRFNLIIEMSCQAELLKDPALFFALQRVIKAKGRQIKRLGTVGDEIIDLGNGHFLKRIQMEGQVRVLLVKEGRKFGQREGVAFRSAEAHGFGRYFVNAGEVRISPELQVAEIDPATEAGFGAAFVRSQDTDPILITGWPGETAIPLIELIGCWQLDREGRFLNFDASNLAGPSLDDAALQFFGLASRVQVGITAGPILGILREASDKTLVLHNVDQLPLGIQSHLAEVIGRGKFQVFGANAEHRLPNRIIATTPWPRSILGAELFAALKGEHRLEFKSDLVPPARIKPAKIIPAPVLKSVSCVSQQEADRIIPDLALSMAEAYVDRSLGLTVRELKALFQTELIIAALEISGNNIRQAARILNYDRKNAVHYLHLWRMDEDDLPAYRQRIRDAAKQLVGFWQSTNNPLPLNVLRHRFGAAVILAVREQCAGNFSAAARVLDDDRTNLRKKVRAWA